MWRELEREIKAEFCSWIVSGGRRESCYQSKLYLHTCVRVRGYRTTRLYLFVQYEPKRHHISYITKSIYISCIFTRIPILLHDTYRKKHFKIYSYLLVVLQPVQQHFSAVIADGQHPTVYGKIHTRDIMEWCLGSRPVRIHRSRGDMKNL